MPGDASVGRLAGRWRDRYALVALCVALYFSVRFSQVAIGPVVPLLKGSLGVSSRGVGLALSGMWAVYALSQFPSGVLADRFGARRVVLAAAACTTLATAALASARTPLRFGLGVLLLGVGAGMYYNPATALLAAGDEGVGGLVGTHRVGAPAAGVLAPPAVTAVAVRFGWWAGVALGAVFTGLVGAVFLWRTSPRPPAHPEASLRGLLDPGALAALLARSHTRLTTAMAAAIEFVGLAAMAFLPTLLTEHHALPLPDANLLFALFFGVGALAQPVSGRVSDAAGRDRTIALQVAAGALGYAVLGVRGAGPLVVPAVVLAGVATSSTPVVQSRMLDGLSAGDAGRGFGLFRTLYLLVGAAGTTVVGTLADAAGWRVAAGALAAPLVAVLLAVVLVGDVRGGD